jgi:hypothetical protein
MGNITASGVRYENGVSITRKLIIPKNKYSEIYQEHKKRIEDGDKEFEMERYDGR